MVESIDDAIAFVKKHNEDCGIEWYGLGKTNNDLLNYLHANNIDANSLGVFIGGNPTNNPEGKLYFCPNDWMDVNNRARFRYESDAAK